MPVERRAEDVAQRGTGVGAAVLFHGFLFFGDLARLDRQAQAAGLASTLVTRTSTLSPTEKRSGRCSAGRG
jgi:hypothetical protein